MNDEGVIYEHSYTVTGRKIPLIEIRQRELTRLEKLGVVRSYSDDFYDKLTFEPIQARLISINEHQQFSNLEEMKNFLKTVERRRHLIW